MSSTVYYVAGGLAAAGAGYLLYDYIKTKDVNGDGEQSLVSRGTSELIGYVRSPNIPNPIVETTRTHWPGSPGGSGVRGWGMFCDDIRDIFGDERAVPCIVALASVETMNGNLQEACWNNNPFNFHAKNRDVTVARVGSEYIRAFGTGYDRELVKRCIGELKNDILRSDTVQAANSGEIDTFQYLLGRQGWSSTMQAQMDPNNPGRVRDPFLFRKLERLRNAGKFEARYMTLIRR